MSPVRSIVRRAAFARSADNSQFVYPSDLLVRTAVGVPFDRDGPVERRDLAADHAEDPLGRRLDHRARVVEERALFRVDELDAHAVGRGPNLDLAFQLVGVRQLGELVADALRAALERCAIDVTLLAGFLLCD